jgi:hypothetical protein
VLTSPTRLRNARRPSPDGYPEKAQGKSNQDDFSGLPRGKARDDEQTGLTGTTEKRPRRFFGSITLDPDKAGPQVAKIAEEILFELTRANGATLKLTLKIEGSMANGYPNDVVDVVRSNIRDLKLDIGDVRCEEG